MVVLFLLILVNVVIGNFGAPQFTNCPTSPSCASVPVSYQCSVEISGSVNSLRWTVLNATHNSLGFSFFLSNAGVGSMGSIGTQFNTEITAAGSPFVSNITFTPTMDIDNYTIECGAASFDGSTTTIVGAVTCPILIEDVLPGIVPNISAINPDNYTISWPPSTSPCLSNYTVNIISTVSDISYGNIPATDTNFVVDISGPFNDTVYSISVAAVDTGGRYMDPVDEISLIIDVPESVTSLTLNQNGLYIAVSWNEPANSRRPNISSYIIYHNVTNPDTSTTILAPTTTYNIPDATVGSVYTVGVAAVNPLGTGPTASATISIISTIVHISSTTVPVAHSTTLLTTGGATQSTLPSLSISPTRITSPTCTSTCTPCTEQSSDTVSALAISFPITVILSVIISSVLSSIITYCCVSRSVKSYSVTNQSTAAADYEIPMKSNSLEMKDNMAYGHVSVGNRSTSGTTPTVYETVQS